MPKFAVTVEQVSILPHETEARVEIAKVGEYKCVVKKGKLKNGSLVAYIPERAIVPEGILTTLGLQGCLAGPDKNLVKATRILGVLSQGLCFPAKAGWVLGQDVTEELGIIKETSSIPAQMLGTSFFAGQDRCLFCTFEDIKRYPDVFKTGERVTFTEKIDGTFLQIGLLPRSMRHREHGRIILSNKDIAEKGQAVPRQEAFNHNTIYYRVLNKYPKLEESVRSTSKTMEPISTWIRGGTPVFILGEVFGSGIKDFSYGADSNSIGSIGFCIFDVYLGIPTKGRFLNDLELDSFCSKLDLQRVPVLYRGPFFKEIMNNYTSGEEEVSGNYLHVREGIIITPKIERRIPNLGRVKLQSINEHYLLRS